MRRPLKYGADEGEVYLLVTALIDQEEKTVSLGIQPQNETLATLTALEDAITDIASPTLHMGVSTGLRTPCHNSCSSVLNVSSSFVTCLILEALSCWISLLKRPVTLYKEERACC